MARRTYQNGSGAEIVRWFRGKRKDVEEAAVGVLYDAAIEGEQTMQHLIATRGTAKSGKAGRIDTGRMHDAVTSRVVRRSDGAQLDIGWIRDREDYFLMQEGGFFNVAAGVDVEGMYALQDTAEMVFNKLDNDIERAIRNA